MYRMWDERYGSDDYAYGRDPNTFIEEVEPGLPPGRFLCLGAGEGRNAVFLAGTGRRVTAVDASAVGLAKARRLAGERGAEVETVQADLREFEMGEGCWDGIVAVFLHLPPALRAHVLAGVGRALGPGGVFVAELYTPAQLRHGTGGPRTEELLVSLEDLTRELPGLEVVVGREVEREIHEGLHHHGTSAVVQFLARRPTSEGATP
jgi:SAM-dependent methyltransferase